MDELIQVVASDQALLQAMRATDIKALVRQDKRSAILVEKILGCLDELKLRLRLAQARRNNG